MKKKKMKRKESKKTAWMLGILSFVLAAALVFVCFQNIEFKKEIKELERGREVMVGEIVNDFVKGVIENLKTCMPVTIMAEGESANVVDMRCVTQG